ncbi:MAG: DUF188 domain-containing protein [Actinobacteria bacterium]|nr:DUF188 domain-containing protein [Actinomycetota bacterium]
MREALALARKYKVPVVLVANGTQNLQKHLRRGDADVEVFTVQTGADSADFAIVEQLKRTDIVLTQDTGLAAMVLGRGARAISPRGRVHSLLTIDMDLELRHVEKKIRRSGGRTGGPRAFLEDDREHFCCMFERVIKEQLEAASDDGSVHAE